MSNPAIYKKTKRGYGNGKEGISTDVCCFDFFVSMRTHSGAAEVIKLKFANYMPIMHIIRGTDGKVL